MGRNREIVGTEEYDKVTALLQFLGFHEIDRDRITISDYNSNEFLIDEGKDMPSSFKNNEVLVCTDEQADEEYEQSVMNLIDDIGLDSFSEGARQWILDNYVDEEEFQRMYEEYTRGYAEDIENEENPSDEYTLSVDCSFESKLVEFAYEDGYLSEGDLTYTDGMATSYDYSYEKEDILAYYKEQLEDEDMDGIAEFGDKVGVSIDEDADKDESIETIMDILERMDNERSDREITLEVEVSVTNRLFQECIENDVISENDLVLGGNIDESGDYIGKDSLVELYCDHMEDPSALGYDSAVEWFKDDFGMQELSEYCKKNEHVIDWDAVIEWTKEQDGRGNELSRWDGVEYEEKVNGTTYYIYPTVDFKELTSRLDSEYPIIASCKDSEYLADTLGVEAMDAIEGILSAYIDGEFTVKEARDENGELDFCGDFEVTIEDEGYEVTGFEEKVARWYESWGVDENDLVEAFEDYQKESLKEADEPEKG